MIVIPQKAIDIEKKYPYKTQDILDYLNDRLDKKITRYSLYAINYEYDVRINPKFFKSNETVSRYSNDSAQWFISEYFKDANWLSTAREHYSRSKQAKSKSNFNNQSTKKHPHHHREVKY